MKVCSVPNCARKHYGRGLCKNHYAQWRRSRELAWPPSLDAQARFWARADMSSGGCWPWTGLKDRDGYGLFSLSDRNMLAHRLAYRLAVGRIPADRELDHLCRNRACVNPDHLEPVTSGENNRRGLSPAALNARKTHCASGHPFTPENTRYRLDGARSCRACGVEAMRRHRQRIKHPTPTPPDLGQTAPSLCPMVNMLYD